MAAHLTIVLPGRGYGAHGPAIHFPRRALEDHGAETVVVEYRSGPQTVGVKLAMEAFHRTVSSQGAAFVEEARPARVTFLAKSLGTIALAALDDPRSLAASVDAIWLTPIFGQEPVRAGAIRHGLPSLLVAGEADALHVPERH